MYIKTSKGKVACTQFPDMSVRTGTRGEGAVKVGLIENKLSLCKLTVVLPTEDGRFSKGDTVYVYSKLYTQPWAKELLTIGEQQFILVPELAIECFERLLPPQTQTGESNGAW